jgi:hypothetical protein
VWSDHGEPGWQHALLFGQNSFVKLNQKDENCDAQHFLQDRKMKSSLSRSSNTKKWIFEPIDLLFLLLICAAAAELPPRCQWISSWLQLGYHFRYKKKASANSRFHHHLCNNTRSKNPFLLFLHPLKKCIVMAANQQLRSKKKSIKKLPAAKNLFLNTLIYWRLQRNPLL